MSDCCSRQCHDNVFNPSVECFVFCNSCDQQCSYQARENWGGDGLVENSIDATSTRDFVAEYVAMVSIL